LARADKTKIILAALLLLISISLPVLIFILQGYEFYIDGYFFYKKELPYKGGRLGTIPGLIPYALAFLWVGSSIFIFIKYLKVSFYKSKD
jgi:hypothetical protein